MVRKRTPLRTAARIGAWVLGVPVLILAVIYVVLLITPIPLPLVNSQVRAAIANSMPEGSHIELGDMALALEDYVWPVIQFSPVAYEEDRSGARIEMEALEVGFSPIRVLWGQPAATVTVVGAHLQVNQDLFGPRLVSFDVVSDENGGPPTVQIREGEDAFPTVGLSSDGVDVRGELPAAALGIRSDNDWLVYNLEAAEEGIASIVEQARKGLFSRLVIRDATLDMNDALYGIFRTFEDINVDIAPTLSGGAVEGTFGANFGGTIMNGNVERVLVDGKPRLRASLTNLDMSAFVPFINDTEAMTGVVGPSAVSMDVGFDGASGQITDGLFHIDMTGMDLRIEDDYFPIATSIMAVQWDPKLGQFTMDETQITVGQTTAKFEGVYRLGLDELYGPVVSMSVQARDISIWSEEGAPKEPFSRMVFQGWSAPLYGAMGIDQFSAEKADGAQLASTGRIDMLRRGMGFDMTIAGDGVTADDLKRLWPYFIAPEARTWFVQNVTGGKLKSSQMRYSFPVGTVPKPGDPPKALPKNSIQIDMVGEDVKIVPVDGFSPISLDGETRLQMKDSALVVSGQGATVSTKVGDIAIANIGFTMGGSPERQVLEISGDLSGRISSLVALLKEQQPEALEDSEIPFDVEALKGQLSLSLVSTIVLDDKGETTSLDYAVNGVIQDFASTAPIENHTIGNGQLSFVASQQGYRVAGQADFDGLPADVVIEGVMAEEAPPPSILLSATLDADDLKKMGFDASKFLKGKVKFVAKPMPDTSIQMAVDVTDATLTIEDLGITKAWGVPGSLKASILQKDDVTEISQVDVGFGDVKLQGSIGFDTKANELRSAEFTSFALSPDDSAQLSVTPVSGGYQVRVRGEQLDLKPMLKRFFSLEEGSTGGPQAASFGDTTLAIDLELKRALGFYRTTAFNVDLDLALRGTDLQKASMSAQFGSGRALSITSNPTPEGRTLSMAFNDLGSVLRLVGVYPNIEGGEGSLVLETVSAQKADFGKFVLRNFAVVDEAKVAEVLSNHQQSRQLISSRNKLEFRSAQVEFIRRSDRVEISDAVLAGDTVGGSARGFIYTDSRQYDITGTYVPLFGLNNVMGRLLGPFAGRDGEGLFGVTFAIRGPLDKPDFRVNPLSALAPGAFRRMFEYRAREIPESQ